MGNCQAVDATTVVIQHPSGKVDKLYWPVSAREIMRMNPGHCVALLLSTTFYPANSQHPNTTTTTTTTTTTNNINGSVRLTRIKLLRPTDTLIPGHVYRLITSQEVMTGLWAKKQAKLKKSQSETGEKPERVKEKQDSALHRDARRSDVEKNNQVTKNESYQPRTSTSTTNHAVASRSRTWQPSLHSISEAGSGSK